MKIKLNCSSTDSFKLNIIFSREIKYQTCRLTSCFNCLINFNQKLLILSNVVMKNYYIFSPDNWIVYKHNFVMHPFTPKTENVEFNEVRIKMISSQQLTSWTDWFVTRNGENMRRVVWHLLFSCLIKLNQ